MKTQRRQILTIVTIALAIFMTNLDTSIVNIALPTFVKTFNADTGVVSRVVLVYLLAMVSLLLVFGRISDRIGAVRVFAWGYGVFSLASLLCALSPTIGWLIAFRFLQGVGSAMLLASWGAITVQYLPPEIRGRAFGMITVFGGVGMAIGAPVGGFLIRWLSWEWIFLVNIPPGLAALLLIRLILNDKKPSSEGSSRFDLSGAILSIAGIFCLFLLLNTGQDLGWLSWETLVMGLVAIALLGGFWYRETHCDSPLLNLKIFSKKQLLAGYATTLAVLMIMMGFNFLFPFFFDFVRKLQPQQTGLLLMTFPLISILLSPVSGYLCDKGSPRNVSLTALACIILSAVMFATFGIETSYLFVIFTFIVFGSGLALFFTANTALVMSHSTAATAGTFSALLAAITYLGSALGINFFELIFSLGFPGTGAKDQLANLPAEMLTRGFLNASFFGIALSLAGLFLVMISRELKKTNS
ncbi:MAG TPA: MFS transporter [Bacteroidales bacterium]|nr:MFS transporter [Bacteroidales bacterium]HSA42468.1 MFS transporter [Bacteroidales bacterium]